MIDAWIVVPAFNEAHGIEEFLRKLSAFVGPYGVAHDLSFTILVVDDGSTDGTSLKAGQLAPSLAGANVTVRVLSFLRNFGQQPALAAGLIEASKTADLAITMDADGEQPCTLIPQLIDEWKAGNPIVHTLRKPHPDLGLFKRAASASYYSLLSRISRIPIRAGMADFKLWDGDLLRQVASFLPHCGSTRVFASWLAPRANAVEFEQSVVRGRVSRFTLRKMLSLAVSGIVRYSDLPLRFSLLVSLTAFLISIALTIFVVWAAATNRVVPGWSSVMIIVSFFGGLQSFCIGILGEYLLRIHFRRSLPTFVIQRSRQSTADQRSGCANAE